MSTTNPFASLFGKSPFKALQGHMRIVLECAREIPPLFDALAAGDQEGVVAAKDKIFAKEAEADRIKNDMRGALPKSLFMPVDRRDLLEVLQMQDSIADEPMLALARRSIDACEQSAKIIEELDELLAMGFRGREATRVEEMVEQLNLIEDDTDELGIELARHLFEHEDEMKPVSVMMWYQLIEWVGDLADYAEKVGDRLRLLIAR